MRVIGEPSARVARLQGIYEYDFRAAVMRLATAPIKIVRLYAASNPDESYDRWDSRYWDREKCVNAWLDGILVDSPEGDDVADTGGD